MSNFEGLTNSCIVKQVLEWELHKMHKHTQQLSAIFSPGLGTSYYHQGLVILLISPSIKDMIGWRSSSILASFPAYEAVGIRIHVHRI